MFIFNIKNIREERNITIYQLSKKTGISRTYLVELENSKKINPTLATLNKIASVLEVNVKDLFYTTLDIKFLKEKMYEKIETNRNKI